MVVGPEFTGQEEMNPPDLPFGVPRLGCCWHSGGCSSLTGPSWRCSLLTANQLLSKPVSSTVMTSPHVPRGLILQDLTFVHLGNPDYIDGKVNFSKRWQQFNILDSMRCFQQA